MKKLKCDCGSKMFYRSTNAMDNIVLTCNPPIHVSVYVCEKCGKRHEIRTQDFSSQHQTSQNVLIDDNTTIIVWKG